MEHTPENVKKLESMLVGEEKLDMDIRDGIILSAAAIVDNVVRKQNDYSRGNYYRWLYVNGCLAAILG
jgi:hypothetical protein